MTKKAHPSSRFLHRTISFSLSLSLALVGGFGNACAWAADGSLVDKANTAFWQRDFHTAQVAVQEMLLKNDLDSAGRARVLTNLAICEAQSDNWAAAAKHSEEALKIAPTDSLTAADASAVQARCLLLADQNTRAMQFYQRAIATAVKIQGEWNTDLAPFYEGLAGCYMHEKNYAAAEAEYKKVSQLDFLKYGGDDPHYAWSLLSLGAAKHHLGDNKTPVIYYKKVFWNFRYQNEKRILEEHKNDPDPEWLTDHLRKQLYGDTGAYNNRDLTIAEIKAGIPASVLEGAQIRPDVREKTFANWYKERVGRERAPGLAFFDPNQPLKGLIITVHGLGLHGGAFSPFAQIVQHQGYGIVSFDVRGFGSYRNDEVYQRLDLNAAVADIQRILRAMRTDFSHTPLILLGESMGGAIVLRIAAESPDLVDAVISSVPSGSRFHSKKTALEVGLKLIKHKHNQFDVGTSIVQQATMKSDLRDMWEGDENVRLKLSAAELLNFQRFMGENVKAAAKITRTPVIIYQGYSDNLVKPMGTLAIYQAIPNKDKDMVFVGRAEHLIFEEGQFDDIVLNGVVEWMNQHLPKSSVAI